MSSNHTLWSRPIPFVVVAAIVALSAFVVMGQVATQPPPQRTSAAPGPQNQNQNPNQNTVAPARDPRALENPPQAARTDQARSDSRQRQGAQSDEQDAAWLGVFLNERATERGASVSHVYPSGPASRAGLQSGDVIQQINGQQVTSGKDLIDALDQMHPGDKAEISVLRDNEPTKLTATLGSRDSFVYRSSNMDRFSGRGWQGGQSDENEDLYNIPLHAMELEHNRRMAEQHQRIETEIAKLRDEVRMLREALQRR
jgi:membrane-associated protease RseP (regulator of RpoE activity)